MVGIVSGNGTGLFNTSADVLGRTDGETGIGQANGQAYVNTNTGNLSIQFLDETVSGSGMDLQALRTYNSLGTLTDGDADGWRWQGENKIVLTSGVVNTSGSTVTRTLSDGSQTVFKWDSIKNIYISKNGSRAHDSITWTPAEGTKGSEWTFFSDSDNHEKEYYNGTTGWIKSVRDAGGNGFNYTYTNGKLSKILDIKSLQSLEFIYGSNGKLERLDTQTITSETSPDILNTLRQVYYGYDASGRLISVKVDLNPDNSSITDVYTTTYTYESAAPNNRIASITQSDGTTASFTYYADGKIKTVTDKAGVTTFNYSTEVISGVTTKKTTVTNGMTNVLTYVADVDGQLLKAESVAIDGVKQSTSYTYDTSGNVLTVTDGRNNVTTYTYDTNGNRIQESTNLGRTVTRIFSPTNMLLNEISYATASEEATHYIYDSKDRLRFTVSPEGRVSEIRYGLYGLVKQTIQYIDAKYNVQSLSSTARLTEIHLTNWLETAAAQSSKIQLTQFEYDVRGNLTKKIGYAVATAAAGGTETSAAEITEYVYSKHSQLLMTVAARGTDRSNRIVVSSAQYDGMGRETNIFNTEGFSSITYGSGANAITVKTGAQLTIVSATDAQGRLISVTKSGSAGDGSNQVRTTNYIYDAAGRLRIVQEPVKDGEPAVRSFTFYDAAGRIRHKVDKTGAITGYTYDADGRVLVEIKYAKPVSSATLATWINAATIPSTITTVPDANNDRTTTYSYDILGRLATTSTTGVSTIVNTYDNASRLIKTVQGDRVTKYFYDKDGLQIGTLDAENFFLENVYDAVGRLIATTRYKFKTTISPQSSSSDSFIDLKANMEAIYNNFPSGEAATASRKLTTFYFYDAQGRQVGVVNERGMLTETVYDTANNNRKTIQYLSNAPFVQNLVPDSKTTLASVRDKALQGKPNAGQTTTTNFDMLGRISSVVAFDGTVTEYIYDTAGRLIRKIDAKGSDDERAARTRYNAFSDVVGTVSGEGELGLSPLILDGDLKAAITDHGTTYLIDQAGRKVVEFGPLEPNKPRAKTFLFYNASGQLTYTLNARGEVAKTTYNTFGQIETVTLYKNLISSVNLATINAGGHESILTGKLPTASALDVVTSTQYNQLGLVKNLTTNHLLTVNNYNQYGQINLTSETSIKDVESSNIFATQTNQDKTTVNIFEYDLLGRVKDVTRAANAINAKTSTNYDGFGRIDQTIDANRDATNIYTSTYFSITRDSLGRHATWVDAFGRTEQTYDGESLGTSYNNVQYIYDDANRKVTIKTGLNGESVSTWKTRTGEVLKVEDGKGNITRYTYTKDGNLDKVIKVINGQDVTVQDNDYDRSGRLYETKDANGVVTRYTYDAANRIIEKAIDPTGLNIRCAYEYDGAGRQLRVTEGFGSATPYITEYIYGTNNKVKQIITGSTANEKKSTLTLESNWTNTQLIQKGSVTTTDPANQNSLIEYDKLGRKISETADAGSGKLNLTTNYKYDANGNLTKIIDANGSITWRVYKSNLLIAEINSVGEVKEWRYDQAGRLTQTIEHGTTVPLESLGSGDNVLGTFIMPATAFNDRITRYVYSNETNKVRFTVDSMGAITETTYDRAGNIETLTKFAIEPQLGNDYSEGNIHNSLDRTDERNQTTRYTYDINNRVLTTTDSAGLLTTNQYDAVGNLVAITEAKDGLSRITRFAYDANNRLRFTVDPLRQVTERTYDSLGNVKRITQYDSKLGALADYRESTVDAAVKNTSGNNHVTLYYYDSNKNLRYTLESFTENLITIKENIYDIFGNLISIIHYSDMLGVDYAADYSYATIDDNLVSRRNSATNTKTRYFYDRNNRLQFTVDAMGAVTENVYDKAGNIITQTFFSKIALAAENISAISIPDSERSNKLNRTTRYAYDKNNRLRFTIDPLGIITENIYNVFGNITTITKFATSPNLGGVYSESNINLSVNRSNSSNQVTAFNYDKSNRISSVINANGVMTIYNYDAFGNKTSYAEAFNSVTPRITRFAYDKNNRLRYTVDAMGAVSEQAYDAFGNIVEKTKYSAIPSLASNYSEENIKNNLDATDPNNRTTRYAYNLNNKLRYAFEQKTATLFNLTESIYDSFGNEIKKIQFDKEFTIANNFKESDLNNLVIESDRAIVSNRIFHFSYNLNNRLRFSIDATGAITENTYDAKGNITSTTLFNSPVVLENNFSEGNINTKVNRSDVANRTTTYSYDVNNRISKTINAEGYTEENIYNATGEVVDIIQHGDRAARTVSVGIITGAIANQATSSTKDAIDLQFTSDRTAWLTNSRELWITKAGQTFKVAENVDSFQVHNNRVAVLKGGTLYVYEGALDTALTNSWTAVSDNVTSFQLENNRIGVLSDNTLKVKDGTLDATWIDKTFTTKVARFQLDGNRIGVLTEGSLYVTEGVLSASAFWDPSRLDVVSDFQLDGNRIGIIENGTLRIKEGALNASWKDQRSNVDKFQLEDKRIAVLVEGSLFAKDVTLGALYSENPAWITELPGGQFANSFKLVGNRIAVLTRDSQLIVKEGLSGGWTTPVANVQHYALTSTFIGFVSGLNDRVTHYTYDNAGRQIMTTLPGWYDSLDGRVYSASEGQPTRFQRTVEVTYDFMGNAVRNKIRVGENEFVYQYKTYDKEGNQIYDVDGLGYVTKKEYNKFGQVTAVTRYDEKQVKRSSEQAIWTTAGLDAEVGPLLSTSYRTIIYDYDILGRQTKIIQPAQNAFRSSKTDSVAGELGPFTINNNLQTYSDSGLTTFEYNSLGDIVKEIKRINNDLTTVNDNLDHVNVAETYYYYDKLGRKTWVVDAEKFGTEYIYDKLGNISSIKEYANKATGNLNSLISPPTYVATDGAATSNRDRILSYKYDSQGRVTETSRNLLSTFLTTLDKKVYNAFGEVKDSIAYGAGFNNVTSMLYNRLGKVTQITEPKRAVFGADFNAIATASPITQFEYNAFGDSTKQTRFNNSGGTSVSVQHIFDFAGNEIETIDALGNKTAMEYDVTGNMIGQKQKASALNYAHTIEQRFEYDAAGRQTGSFNIYENGTKKSGQVSKYNGYGEVVEEKSVWGSAQANTNSLLKNASSNVLIASYKYDNAGRIKSKTSAEGYYFFYYDLAGNLTRSELRKEASGTNTQRITEAYYDLLGRTLVQRLPSYSVNQTNIELPAQGDFIFGPVQTPKIVNTVDRWGNVLTQVDQAGYKTTFTYNQNNQLLSEIGDAISTIRLDIASPNFEKIVQTTLEHKFTYDQLGNNTSETFSAYLNGGNIGFQRLTKEYNEVGQLTKTVNAASNTVEYKYNGFGNQVASKDGVGKITINEYDSNNQLTGIYRVRNSTNISLAKYSYDQAGRMFSEFDGAGNAIKYTFDERDNNIAIENRLGGITKRDYDELNNKFSEKIMEGSTVISESSWSFKTDSGSYVSYNSQQAQSHSAGGITFKYVYDGFGQLIKEATSNNLSTIDYTYWQNGLKKSTHEKTTLQNGDLKTQTNYYNATSYDIKGNAVITLSDSWYYLESLPAGWSDPDWTITATSGKLKTVYTYDKKNRLTNVSSPSVAVSITGKTQSDTPVKTTSVESLDYFYDEWGNRKKISTTYRPEGATTSSKKEEWYTYDNANRVTLDGGINKSGTIVAGGAKGNDNEHPLVMGTIHFYDGAGRRTWEESMSYYDGGGTSEWTLKRYKYTDLGLIEDITESTYKRNGTTSDLAITVTKNDILVEHNIYDDQNRGFLRITERPIDKRVTETNYNAMGGITSQITKKDGVEETSSTLNSYEYELSGNVKSYKQGGNLYTYNYINTYSGRQAKSIVLSTKGTPTTDNFYDMTGHLIRSIGSHDKLKDRVFFYNDANQIVIGSEKKSGTDNKFTAQVYFYVDGGELANFGNADFGYGNIPANISPLRVVTSNDSVPGSYTVNADDTLMSISQAVFGDGKYWYLIADANGLVMRPGDTFSKDSIGRNLKIPNQSFGIGNTSSNLKPYDAASTIGDLTPVMKPPKKKGCNAIASIIMIVVAVIVTIYTAGAAATLFATAGTTVSGTAVLAGTAAAASAGALSTGAMIAAAAIGGFAGSVASQLVGKGLGVVDHFSLRQAVGSGLTAGFAAGAGAYLQTLSSGTLLVDKAATATEAIKLTAAGHMAQGAASYLGAYASNRLAGLTDNHFNWTDLAVATVSSGITGSSGNALTESVSNYANGFTTNIIGNMWGSTVSSSLSRLAGRGEKQDWEAMAVDAFGNASASYVVNELSTPKQQPKYLSANARDPRTMSDVEVLGGVDGNITPAQAAQLALEAQQSEGGFFNLNGMSDNLDSELAAQAAEFDSLVKDLEKKLGVNAALTVPADSSFDIFSHSAIDTTVGMWNGFSSEQEALYKASGGWGNIMEPMFKPVEGLGRFVGNTVGLLSVAFKPDGVTANKVMNYWESQWDDIKSVGSLLSDAAHGDPAALGRLVPEAVMAGGSFLLSRRVSGVGNLDLSATNSLYTERSIFANYPEQTTLQFNSAAEQAEFLSIHIPGLNGNQASSILEAGFSRDSSLVFGGSRIRGNFNELSDLDVGFGNLSERQAQRIIKNINGQGYETQLENLTIVPGKSTPTIQTITTPEEFFQRAGIRAGGDLRAGQPYSPSGSVTVTKDGQIVIIPPRKP